MEKTLSISTRWIQNKIFWLLLLTPLTFKIEIFPKVIIFPQEIILPFMMLLYFFSRRKIKRKVPKMILPYIYLALALLLTIILTLFSLFREFDIVGLLKLFKYSIYVISIIIIFDYISPKFVKRINIVAILTIVLTLIMYYINKVNSGHSWSTFTAMATYISNYMPTGFSNRVLNLQSQSFVVYSGNHGIYGSYLALILFFNISAIIRGTIYKRICYLAIILSIINLMLLTSRETLLLLVVTLFSFTVYHLSFMKFKLSKVLKAFLFFIFSITILVWVVNYYEIELSIVNKITNSINRFRETGGDGSINVRFNTWALIFLYLFTNPWVLLIGTGFNPTLFREKIDFVASLHPNIGEYVGIPESLFIGFLSYGGIFALLFIILFLYYLFKNLLKKRNTIYGLFIPFYILGIIVTNNTGASIIAELLMTQFALVYLFIMNSDEKYS